MREPWVQNPGFNYRSQLNHFSIGADNKHFIIKNPNLIAELERKLFRILAVENADKNHFRQHISDVKTHLLKELGTD